MNFKDIGNLSFYQSSNLTFRNLLAGFTELASYSSGELRRSSGRTRAQADFANNSRKSRFDPTYRMFRTLVIRDGEAVPSAAINGTRPYTMAFHITPIEGGSLVVDFGDDGDSPANPSSTIWSRLSVSDNALTFVGPTIAPVIPDNPTTISLSATLPDGVRSRVVIAINPGNGKGRIWVNGRIVSRATATNGVLGTGTGSWAGEEDGTFTLSGHTLSGNKIDIYAGTLPRGF